MNKLYQDPLGVVKDVISGFQRDDGIGLSAEAAFRLVFALPALAMFFASMSSIAAEYTGVDAFQSLLDRARENLPPQMFLTLDRVLNSVQDQSGAGFLSISLVIALWSGSNALAAIVKAINRAHSLEDERGFVHHRVVALILTIGLSLLVFSSLALLFFGQGIGNDVASMLGYGDLFSLIWNIARWPVLLFLFMTALTILYRFGPPEETPYPTLVPGVITATLLWLAASFGFNIYLAVANPGSAYGILGGIIALLLFLYLTSIVVIIGAEINAALLRRQEDLVAGIQHVDDPTDIMSPRFENPAAGSGAKASSWLLAGILVGGVLLAGLLKRRQEDTNDP